MVNIRKEVEIPDLLASIILCKLEKLKSSANKDFI